MKRLALSKKRVTLAVLLVALGLAASVVVARAAMPTITGVSVPPSAHFGGTCSRCHLLGSAEPITLPSTVVDPGRSDETTDTLKVVGSRGRGKAGDQHETVSGIRESGRKRIGDRDAEARGSDGGRSDEHETVSERVHERDSEGGTTKDHDGRRDDGQNDGGKQDSGGRSD